MQTLVTGATGFLGSNLCKFLESKGHEIVPLNSKNCDLTQQDSLLNFNNKSYDRIYHLAAWTQAGDFCLYHPGEQWIINQKINTNLLSWWQKFQPQAKCICIGTSCAYDPNVEMVEENYFTGLPIDSLFTYAMTKRMLSVGLLALQKQYRLNHLTLVPSTLYGPGYHTDGRQMHFIFDLVRKILRAKLYGEQVILWGDGYQQRELIYVDDFVKIMWELDEKCNNELINIGAGEEFSIRFFAKKICEIVEYDFSKIQFDTNAYVGARSKCLNIKKLNTLLPNNNLTSMDKGLKKTIDWFLENQKFVLPKNS